VRGFYIPEMVLQHIIPAERLDKRYFRRWFYWRGISRAMLYQRSGLDMETPEQTTLDFSKVPHVAGVPRYLYRKALTTLKRWAVDALRGRSASAFDHELWLCFFAGIVRQRWQDVARAPRSAAGGQGSGTLPRVMPLVASAFRPRAKRFGGLAAPSAEAASRKMPQ
jgi:hypothetical protein